MLSSKTVESFNLNERPDAYLGLGAAENASVAGPARWPDGPRLIAGRQPDIPLRPAMDRFPQFTTVTIHGANTNHLMRMAFLYQLPGRGRQCHQSFVLR